MGQKFNPRIRYTPLASNEPEWLRVPEAQAIFRTSRNTLFDWMADGSVESRHIIAPGKTRGYRLINVASLRAKINSFSSEVVSS